MKTDESMIYISKDIECAVQANDSDSLSWNPERILLPFTLGEVCLCALKFRGIRSDPDIFKVPTMGKVPPPVSALKNAGRQVAYIYSCPLYSRLPTFSLVGGHIRYVSQQYQHYYVCLDQEFRDYLVGFSTKTLSTLMRKVRKAESSNRQRQLFRTYSHPDDIDEFFDTALPISEKSYQQQLLGQGLPRAMEYREHVKSDAEQGRFLGFLLYVEDTPVAYNCCPVRGGNAVLYDHTGYDPEFSKYSPGTVLQYKIIENLFEKGRFGFYDLCTGEGRHKELFATGSMLCANVYFFPITFHHALFVCLKILVDKTTSCVNSLVDRVGVKDKLKKLIRRTWKR
ncbi:GNAT family N-acetyltransferase [Tautonia rosea]|uniref:GNAT family N-acetyltransferase n=1 Tax=Tautonia rosea TaxID=2728037 RepID=UPI001473EC98|nr:GNAT family N-acetyltransferase [Tautonia rosea]